MNKQMFLLQQHSGVFLLGLRVTKGQVVIMVLNMFYCGEVLTKCS